MAIIDSYIAPTSVWRLHALLRKADRGEPIRIAGLGGSITGGAGASSAGNRFLNLSANWFLNRYGVDAQARLINAGIGSTESPYAALRVEDQVLQYRPDLVFLDFSVNNAPLDLDSYESLIRKLRAWRPSVAIIPVQLCNEIGQGQGIIGLEAVCAKYGLGSVSYQRDILAYIAAGGDAPADFGSGDGVHPGDAGHARIADDVWYWLDQVNLGYIAAKGLIAEPTDNNFERTAFIEGAALPTFYSNGFTYNGTTRAYGATVAGTSYFEHPINVGGSGKIWVACRISNSTANGVISTFVDGVAQSTIDTYDAAWSFDKIEVFQIATGVAPGEHRLRLIAGAGATGANVDIFGIGWTKD
jgi:lysophospholipase L1-like esterase